ncbi:PilZ domain-containing protein [Alteromonas sp. ASW11-130]|uniref:PilZ domain-containing protein n=1 Tax=Alteromonas sp. ASW11-130 TaxID=3015775 RepID=UPI002241AE57|nr:PilZ domain-containing protein [Alteromonas sp. ASW11-130]MCW8093001.1 PilZ domain-containing protein [Alteromonas sp. ASW11-130]
MTDKRQFQRIPMGVPGRLSHQQVSIPVEVVDISLQGLRIRVNESTVEALPFDSHEPYIIEFQPNADSPAITVHLQQLYRFNHPRIEDTLIGCKVDHIDVEDLAALRRLIQLNCGNEKLSEHDLNALIEGIVAKSA